MGLKRRGGGATEGEKVGGKEKHKETCVGLEPVGQLWSGEAGDKGHGETGKWGKARPAVRGA